MTPTKVHIVAQRLTVPQTGLIRSSYFEEHKEQDTASVWGIFTVVSYPYPIVINKVEKHRDPLVCCWPAGNSELCSLVFVILIQGTARVSSLWSMLTAISSIMKN